MFNDNNSPLHTKVVFSNDARKSLYTGLRTAAEAVGATLGPKGRTVIIQRKDESPVVTKDGVTVSKSIKLRDPLERMGAELIREAAVQTNEIAGDGTTTSTILTHALVREGLKLLEAGFSSRELITGINRGMETVIEALKSSSKELTTPEEIAQVGTISANGDEKIGKLIADAMSRVGKDGIITVEDAKGMTTSLDVVEGMQFERGYLSPYFVTNADRMNVVYPNARVLVTDRKISTLKDILGVLEAIAQSREPLLIIADEVEGEALQALVLNRVKNNLNVVAIKAPGFGSHRDELLNDICVLTGARLASSSTGVSLDKLTRDDLGRVAKVVVDAKTTTLVGTGDTQANVQTHVDDLRSQLVDVSLTQDEVRKLQNRIARLAGGVAIIRVGGATETEMIERKYRIEDALNATRAAADEGIVPGGGLALTNAALALDELSDVDNDHGVDIVRKACHAPFARIVQNAGLNHEVILAQLEYKRHELAAGMELGFNAATGEFQDLMRAGVIDPVKVTRTALKNAVSVAVTFLSLDAAIVEDNDGTKDK